MIICFFFVVGISDIIWIVDEYKESHLPNVVDGLTTGEVGTSSGVSSASL